jgi:AraC family transcriptional regulator, regulatory protein of adaptative response / DNA-3-methyladenine glycosylase II
LRIVSVRAPFDADAAFGFLAARQVDGLDVVEARTYTKAVEVSGRIGVLTVTYGRRGLEVRVTSGLSRVLDEIAERVRLTFDVDADLKTIGAHLSKDRRLAAHVRARPGLRVMSAFDPFEWATRAVLGQQVSVRAARTLAARLLARFGRDVRSNVPPARWAWPTAARLSEESEESLAAIGLTRARARTLLGLSKAVASGAVVLDRANASDTRDRLLALSGIGPWTADYIVLRALGGADAFPAGDLGLRKALGNVTTAACEARSQRWRPYRAYAAMYLWTA